MKITHIFGSVNIKTLLSIEELGKLISNAIFSGASFRGKQLNIYEEVPAIFIKNGILGLDIVLQGEPGLEEAKGYSLDINPNHYVEGDQSSICLDEYLFSLFQEKFIARQDIFILP